MIKDFVVFDIETTGLDAKNDRIIEIGAVKYVDGRRYEDFATFVNPRMSVPERITQITGIEDSMVADAPDIDAVLPEFLDFIGGLPLMGHNVLFDFSFIKRACVNRNMTFERQGIDTLKIARRVHPELTSRSLEAMCTLYDINEEPRHRAFSDAAATARLYGCLYETAVMRCRQNEENASAPEQTDLLKLMSLFEPEPLIYQVKKEGPATKKQVEYLTKLISMYHVNFDRDIASLTKNQASREIDKLLFQFGHNGRP